MPLPSLLTTRDLPAPELGGMRLDGEIYQLAEAWCSIDLLETSAHRAEAVRGLRSDRLIAELGTAAWVWGATPVLPAVIEFCVDLGARARLGVNPTIRVRELVLDPGDRVDLRSGSGSCGGAVTSRLRTAVDLARFRDVLSEADAASIVGLAHDGGFHLEECRELMNRRRNLPEKRRALVRLAELL